MAMRTLALVVSVLILLTGGLAWAYLTDNAIHQPATSGTYNYAAFGPGASGFPSVGGSYTDPIFGGVITRLTAIGNVANNEDIYGHHWLNANGTYIFNRTATTTNVLNATTGAVVWANSPCGSVCFEMNWHPTNPDLFYTYNGAALVENTVSTKTSTTIHTFPSALQSMGGSLNWVDATGDMFVVMLGGQANVWKRSLNLTYTNTVPPLSSGGWVAITPDGNYLVTAAGGGGQHYSYSLNNSTHTVNTTPTNFWSLCGDHGALTSASNGKNYFVTFDCNYTGYLYRVDITLAVGDTSNGSTNHATQTSSNQVMVPTGFYQAGGAGADGHISGGCIGTNQDWVAFDSELIPESAKGGSNFGDDTTVSHFSAYQSEIILMNVVTLEVRRYAHHRSRVPGSSGAQYYDQPRITTSWDCTRAAWTSNYDQQPVTGYADLYSMPLSTGSGTGTTPPAAPTNLRVQ